MEKLTYQDLVSNELKTFRYADTATPKQVRYLKNLKFIMTGSKEIDETKLSKITKYRKETSLLISKQINKLEKLEKLFIMGDMINNENKEVYYEILVRYYLNLYLTSLDKNNKPKSLFNWLAQLNVIKYTNKITNNYSVGVFNKVDLTKTPKTPKIKTAKTAKKTVNKTPKKTPKKTAKIKTVKTKINQ
jgi:hypothetical protein